jgi:hypothetical protein
MIQWIHEMSHTLLFCRCEQLLSEASVCIYKSSAKTIHVLIESQICSYGIDPALTFPEGLWCEPRWQRTITTTKSEGRCQSERSNSRNRFSKECVSASRSRCERQDYGSAPTSAASIVTVHCTVETLSGRNGSVRWRTPLRSRDRETRTRSEADESTLRAAVPEVE